jgi:cell division protein FtsL
VTRFSALVWFILVLAAGFATFKVKYAVQDIEDQLTRLRKQTVAEQQEIRVLTAEWTYLAQPERLADLNQRFLGLQPIAPKQLQRTIADLPIRAHPPAADTLVAASNNPVATAPAPVAAPPVAAPPVAPAADVPTPPRPAPPVQLVKAAGMPDSLDALIAQIAEAR